MGDKIIIEKIELIYDRMLFQIDYYNENKNYHGRMFIGSEKLFSIADAELVKHAHWIVDVDEGIVKCSNPDCLEEFSDNGECVVDYWRYCPYCGAKMDEEKE